MHGLTRRKVAEIYTVFARDAFEHFDMPIELVPKFSIKPLTFHVNGTPPLAGTAFNVFSDGKTVDPNDPYATDIVLNTLWFNKLDFDELICVLLHEIAHATAYDDYADGGHGEKWVAHATELGSVPSPHFISRYTAKRTGLSPSLGWTELA